MILPVRLFICFLPQRNSVTWCLSPLCCIYLPMHQEYLLCFSPAGPNSSFSHLCSCMSFISTSVSANDMQTMLQSVCSVSAERSKNDSSGRVERSEGQGWNSSELSGSDPQRTRTWGSAASGSLWASHRSDSPSLTINKDWKTLNAASVQVGGLWEAIWLCAWQQIPCWSNRWPSASWELQYVHKYLF